MFIEIPVTEDVCTHNLHQESRTVDYRDKAFIEGIQMIYFRSTRCTTIYHPLFLFQRKAMKLETVPQTIYSMEKID